MDLAASVPVLVVQLLHFLVRADGIDIAQARRIGFRIGKNSALMSLIPSSPPPGWHRSGSSAVACEAPVVATMPVPIAASATSKPLASPATASHIGESRRSLHPIDNSVGDPGATRSLA
ncbi:hypothetical protein PG991_009038 [Apiospora marii]|uniref:Uncharacterized protein n=1 Tax=Apiospora marii TaxID=335849 RepID=A0ABR1RKV9_9PEZI